MTDRHLVDVHVLLIRDRRVLLSERRGDEFDGMWHLPAGKVDAGEDLVSAAVREAAEETGVSIDPGDLAHVHVVHAIGSGLEPRIGHFFTATRWRGDPINREPAKCHRLEWFDLDRLPSRIIDYPAAGLHAYRNGDAGLSLLGWQAPAPPN
ncbi:NUDIX hydrolase [Parasphingorhabdus pacifica]